MNIIDLTRKFKKDLEKQDIHLLWWVSSLYNKTLKKIQSKYEELVSEIYENPQAKTNQINKIEAVKVTLRETEKIIYDLDLKITEAIKTSQNAAEKAVNQHTETVFEKVKETLKKTVSNLSSDTADENQQKEEKQAEKEPKTGAKPNTSNTVKKDTEKTIKAKTEKGEPLEKTVSEHSMTPEKVIKTLREGITKGKTEKQIAKEMVQSGYEDKKRALRIARTELMKTAHDVSLENYRKNGVEEVIWVSGETAHTCAACWAMSGRRFKIDDVPYDHPNGRCQLSPYLPELEEFNPEAYNHDTEAEFNRLTEEEQKNILGKTGFDLWKKGEAKLSDFAQIKDNDIWGRQIGLQSAESLKKKEIKTEKHKENIPVKEKYSEKPTENSKAKETEKIPEKEEKKTASELTNDNKISYNISERNEFKDLHGKPLTEELSGKIKNNEYYLHNLEIEEKAQNVHLPDTKEHLKATKTQTKSVILSINGKKDNDKILKLCNDILKADKEILELKSFNPKKNKWCGKSIAELKDFEIIYKDKKEKIRKTNTITIHTKQNGSAHIVPYKGEIVK